MMSRKRRSLAHMDPRCHQEVRHAIIHQKSSPPVDLIHPGAQTFTFPPKFVSFTVPDF
jgi:hypothetical protein